MAVVEIWEGRWPLPWDWAVGFLTIEPGLLVGSQFGLTTCSRNSVSQGPRASFITSPTYFRSTLQGGVMLCYLVEIPSLITWTSRLITAALSKGAK